MRKLDWRVLFLALCAIIGLCACSEPTAPQQCTPNFDNPDSSKTIPFAGDTVPIIRVAWCGPITVQ